MTRKKLIGCLRLSPSLEEKVGGDGGHPPRPLVPAAVLVPLIERLDGFTLMLTRRTADLRHHAGQISFPGGRVEPEDDSPEITALRETQEEIGLAGHQVEIIGRLDRYITRTGYSITPVVGILVPPFELRLDPREVAEVFEVPLDFILDPVNHQRCRLNYEGEELEFYAMPWGEYYIWGATAGMLHSLYRRLLDG